MFFYETLKRIVSWQGLSHSFQRVEGCDSGKLCQVIVDEKGLSCRTEEINTGWQWGVTSSRHCYPSVRRAWLLKIALKFSTEKYMKPEVSLSWRLCVFPANH